MSFRPFASEPSLQLDGHDVAVHVHEIDLAGVEQAPGQLGRGPGSDGLVGLGEALVAHARQCPVGLEPHEAGDGALLLDDGDRLAHGDEGSGRVCVANLRRPRALSSRTESRIVAPVATIGDSNQSRGFLRGCARPDPQWPVVVSGRASSVWRCRARRRTRLTTTSAATASATDTTASTVWTALKPALWLVARDVPDAGAPHPDRPEGEDPQQVGLSSRHERRPYRPRGGSEARATRATLTRGSTVVAARSAEGGSTDG